MSARLGEHGLGVAAVLFAALVWGTTGTVATLAPSVGPAAIGACAMGLGGLMQAALAGRGLVAAEWSSVALFAMPSRQASGTPIWRRLAGRPRRALRAAK